MAYQLPALPYSMDALEPFYEARTLEIHYGKHHKTYMDKVNAALEKFPELAAKDINELLRNLKSLPDAVKTPVRNAGGGFANHTFFWHCLAPQAGGKPKGKIQEALEKQFGSFEAFREQFTNQAAVLFGSGWTWLSFNEGKLQIENTPNQDTPLSEGRKPLLVIDIWEHAYYLQYQNRRPEYIEAFWNLVNWKKVDERLLAARS